jgi:transcriptional regulator with XRE-family HTH domain
VPPPSKAQLGAAIRRVREENGQTLEEVAALADLHWVYLSEIERGRRNPSWTAVGKIADAFGMEIADLEKLAAQMPG